MKSTYKDFISKCKKRFHLKNDYTVLSTDNFWDILINLWLNNKNDTNS